MTPFVQLTVDTEDGQGTTLKLSIPQSIVDKMAELFPDVKPSPPTPKAGDRVRTKYGMTADVISVYADCAWLTFSNHHPSTFEIKDLTVIERGES